MKALLGQSRQRMTIANRRNGKVQGVDVARPSVLGNPFVIGKDGSREQVIEQYRVWLRAQYRQGGEVHRALRKLAHRYIEDGALTLVCWCAPKTCHAEVLR